MQGMEPKNCSYAFGSLFKACTSFKEGLYQCLGNGKKIRIDNDRWHPSVNIKPKFSAIHPLRENYTMIADLINTDRSKKASAVWSLYQAKEAKEILATHIPREEEEDKIG